MEEKKIWHDAKNETPTENDIIVLICNDVDGNKMLVYDITYGIPEKPDEDAVHGYGDFAYADVDYIDDERVECDVDIPDHDVYYKEDIDDSYCEYGYSVSYSIFTKPIKWAYMRDISEMLLDM